MPGYGCLDTGRRMFCAIGTRLAPRGGPLAVGTQESGFARVALDRDFQTTSRRRRTSRRGSGLATTTRAIAGPSLADVAGATTPGSFVVPPPRTDEMSMPETFGRGAGDRVVIE